MTQQPLSKRSGARKSPPWLTRSRSYGSRHLASRNKCGILDYRILEAAVRIAQICITYVVRHSNTVACSGGGVGVQGRQASTIVAEALFSREWQHLRGSRDGHRKRL